MKGQKFIFHPIFHLRPSRPSVVPIAFFNSRLGQNQALTACATAWPDLTAVEHYVDIRSTLVTSGTLISQPDLWIAAITWAAGGIFVTHNSQEFSRVPGLMLEDWLP